MSFVHDDAEFPDLVRIVAAARGLSPALVEKDYWVTHALWALHAAGFEVWFEGGTSLSKGFGLIQRFSEDLDLKLEPGSVTGLPTVASWTSESKGRIRQRQAYFEALEGAITVPGAEVILDRSLIDPRACTANLRVDYGGAFVGELGPEFRPYVLLEVGSARVAPFVLRPLSSFVHDWLEGQEQLGGYAVNRPAAVRCVHPWVTLIEKLDAISRRYAREPLEPAAFVRHYEDAARIAAAGDALPLLDTSARALAEDMLAKKQIAALPRPDDPGLALAEPEKAAAVERSYEAIAPMFWGERLDLREAIEAVQAWLGGELGAG